MVIWYFGWLRNAWKDASFSFLKFRITIKGTSGMPGMRSNKLYEYSTEFGNGEQLQTAVGCWEQWVYLGLPGLRWLPWLHWWCFGAAIYEELVMNVDGMVLPSLQSQMWYFYFPMARVTLFLEVIGPHDWGIKFNFSYKLVNNLKPDLYRCMCTCFLQASRNLSRELVSFFFPFCYDKFVKERTNERKRVACM